MAYSQTGQYGWTDPSTGQTYQIPTFTSNQSYAIDPHTYLQQNPDVAAYAQANGLNPADFAQQHWEQYGQGEGRAASGEAALYNTGLQSRQQLANMGLSQAQRASGILSTPFDPSSGGPAAGNAQSLYNVPQAATSYDAGGPITTSYGPSDNFSADRQRVEDSLMARMNPQLAIEKQGIQQQLADQGIRPGSQAYSDAMMTYSRQADDARYGAIAQGGQEQMNLNSMAAQQAAFQNAAQGQQYQQNAGLAAFGNAGLAQQLAQQQSGFNASNAARNQYLQEQYQQRNQPLNEISALMSGSQVQQPNWLNSPTSQIPTTDFAGIMNANAQQQQQAYQTAQSGWNSLMGGILGLGAGAIKASDERVKDNIIPMGTVFAADADDGKKELPIYQYSYKADPASTRHIGPMAQDVAKVDPKAVKSIGGVKHIDTRMVMGSILRAA